MAARSRNVFITGGAWWGKTCKYQLDQEHDTDSSLTHMWSQKAPDNLVSLVNIGQ
jgi:hypothetical protein